jgi:hypothetical protein
MKLVTKPEWQMFDRSIVSVALVPDAPSGWAVTLSIAHPTAIPIHANALAIVLRDASQQVIALHARPTDPLIEVGGAQSATTQATFHSEPSVPLPSTVAVTVGALTRVFEVVAISSTSP